MTDESPAGPSPPDLSLELTPAVRLLRAMLEIESLSGQEGQLATFLVERMRALGLKAYIDEAGNAIGLQAGPATGDTPRDIILLGHMDTVAGHIPVKLEGGRLYGRGVVDAKGPLAAFITAAASVSPPAGTRIIVIGAVEEESASSAGARHLLSCYDPRACVIGEPGHWEGITLGYKGRLLVDYHLERSCAHSAGPGSTAVEEATVWWQAVQGLCQRMNRETPRLFDRLSPCLCALNSSSDGLSERVEAQAGFRLPPGLDLPGLELQLQTLAGDAQLRFHGHIPAFSASRTQPLVRLFARAISRAGGHPSFRRKTGTSDMNVVGPVWNSPILAYGPGDSALDHTPEEHLLVPEYLKAIEVLTRVLTLWSSQTDPATDTTPVEAGPRAGSAPPGGH